MKSLIKLFSYLGSVLLICAVVSACAPTKPIVDSTTWLIAPKRVGETRKANSDFWLKMGAVSVNSPFDSKSMVYRLSDQRYEKDFYNGYISTPAEMIGNATRQWLAD
ncbi:MAG: hypothetical protein RLZZ549_1280, partial [Pseudomonadota bacterium]